MARALLFVIAVLFLSCGKSIEVVMPPYESKLVVEMYLEDGKPLRCLLTESVPYGDTIINKPVNDLTVLLYTVNSVDTLHGIVNNDWETGREYNYYNPVIFKANSSVSYSVKIVGKDKELVATTSFIQNKVPINIIDIKPSPANSRQYSVGLQVTDPADSENYYRFLITRKLNDFNSEPTDLITSDMAFNGKKFSLYSDAVYAKGDTVLVRVYSLHKAHYQFLQSAKEARKANFNVFSQPSLLQSNIQGGTGIFTTIVYDEKNVVVN